MHTAAAAHSNAFSSERVGALIRFMQQFPSLRSSFCFEVLMVFSAISLYSLRKHTLLPPKYS